MVHVDQEVNLPPFTILTVCTGNLVRSAVTAQLLAARLGEAPDARAAVTVSSAGIAAVDGDGMPEQAEALSHLYGGDPTGHRARLLTADLLVGADLVLTATREHRAAAVSLRPAASRRTFTINQFARLVESLEADEVKGAGSADSLPAGFTALVEAAASQRGSLPLLADPAFDDIDDPYRQPQAAYDRVGVEIDEAVRTIATALLAVQAEHARQRRDGSRDVA